MAGSYQEFLKLYLPHVKVWLNSARPPVGGPVRGPGPCSASWSSPTHSLHHKRAISPYSLSPFSSSLILRRGGRGYVWCFGDRRVGRWLQGGSPPPLVKLVTSLLKRCSAQSRSLPLNTLENWWSQCGRCCTARKLRNGLMHIEGMVKGVLLCNWIHHCCQPLSYSVPSKSLRNT